MFCLKEKIFPECLASVVIPVRDEAAHLRKSLESFSNQVNLRGEKFNPKLFEIIILTNNCSDDSYEIACRFQTENKGLSIHIANILTEKQNANSGFVRRLMMEKAYRRLILNERKGGVILTTDGDTQVAENWIATNVFEIANGADAVGGRILFTRSELAKMNPAARRFHLTDEKYRLLSAKLESFLDNLPHDPAPRHHQHFNGSFSVTTEAYCKAGGIPDVRFLEDIAFYHALLRMDAKFRHSPLVKVYTSARENGRTEAGLSTQINDWINLGARGAEFLVDSADALEQRFTNHGNLRLIWNKVQNRNAPENSEIRKLAESYRIPSEDLHRELQKPHTFGLLLENVYHLKIEKNGSADNLPLVPVEQAVVNLEEKLEIYRRKKAVAGFAG